MLLWGCNQEIRDSHPGARAIRGLTRICGRDLDELVVGLNHVVIDNQETGDTVTVGWWVHLAATQRASKAGSLCCVSFIHQLGTCRALCRIKLLPVTHVLVDTWMLTVKLVYESPSYA